MNYLPSKELLSEVLDTTITELAFKNNYVEYTSSISGNPYCYITYDKINIYELAHMCKVWATENKYTILTEDMYPNGYFAYVLSNKESIENYGYLCEHKVIKDIPHNKTEPEAIFKACQWILDNRNHYASKTIPITDS